MTAGPQRAAPAGALPTCCPTSGAPRPSRRGRRLARRATARSMSWRSSTRPTVIRWPAAFLAAAVGQGFPFSTDIGGEQTTGAAWNQLSIVGARRDSTATAYLDPIAGRPNLTILTGAEVLRLTLEAGRCTGLVSTSISTASVELRVEREVILAAGAVDSPKLLQLSGIGPADRLRALGIPAAVDLAGVGQRPPGSHPRRRSRL